MCILSLAVKETSGERWKATLLVIEDDADQIRLYTKALPQYRLLCVPNGTAALKIVAEEIPDLIILDHLLAGGERGTDFLPTLKTDLAHVPIILISGTLDIKGQLKALQGPFSAHYLIEKPVDVAELRKTVTQALEECGMVETVRAIHSLERAEMIRTNEPERQFAARLARQQEVLNRLRSTEQGANVSQLAREFKVSRRTIARDLQDLVNRGQLSPKFLPE